MATDPFDKFNDTDPTAGQDNNTGSTTDNNSDVGLTGNTSGDVNVDTGASATQGNASIDPPVTDTFIDDFNKRFNAQYKTEDEIKPLFELPKRIAEYEERIKDRDALAQSVEQHKKDLEELRKADTSKYLADPIMQKAWIAKQLKEKYPNSDPFTLQEIAMSDMDKMGDLDAVAKERKIKYPSMPLENIKKVILSDLGIDATTNPEEWDGLAKDKLTMMAGDAREKLRDLTKNIEFPKVESQEEIQRLNAEKLSKRTEQALPFKTEYSKYDKFIMGDGLDYTVPKEFQEKLPSMFDAFILQAGNEPTKENIETLNSLRDAFFFNTYKKEIYETMYKDAEAKVKAKLDEKLGNTSLPNTATASDGANGANSNLPGHSQFRSDTQGDRATRLR